MGTCSDGECTSSLSLGESLRSTLNKLSVLEEDEGSKIVVVNPRLANVNLVFTTLSS